MKIRHFITITTTFFSFLVLSSCEKIDLANETTQEETVTEKGTGELYITCTFSQTQGEIDDTRATTTPLYECAKRVVFILMQNGKVCKMSEQINGGGNSFGTLSLDIEEGTYQLLVFAHNSDYSVNVFDDGSIAFTEGLPTDCFSYSTEIVISAGKRKSVSCKLTRSVCQITINSRDAVPRNVTEAKVAFKKISIQYDLLHQIGSGSSDFSLSLYPSEFKNENGVFSISNFLFLPSAECLINANIIFLDSSGTVVSEQELDDIQAKINANTTVSADLFDSFGMDVYDISVDTDWDNSITQSF